MKNKIVSLNIMVHPNDAEKLQNHLANQARQSGAGGAAQFCHENNIPILGFGTLCKDAGGDEQLSTTIDQGRPQS